MALEGGRPSQPVLRASLSGVRHGRGFSLPASGLCHRIRSPETTSSLTSCFAACGSSHTMHPWGRSLHVEAEKPAVGARCGHARGAKRTDSSATDDSRGRLQNDVGDCSVRSGCPGGVERPRTEPDSRVRLSLSEVQNALAHDPGRDDMMPIVIYEAANSANIRLVTQSGQSRVVDGAAQCALVPSRPGDSFRPLRRRSEPGSRGS